MLSTGQIPRPALSPTELLAKCPKCSPGKPRRQAYSAHINIATGSFNCTNCFTKGAWPDYVYLAKKNKLFSRTRQAQRPEDTPALIDEAVINQLVENLQNHNDTICALCGNGAGQLRFKPETLRLYRVGLGYIRPDSARINFAEITEPREGSEKYLIFPRTAFSSTPLDTLANQPDSRQTPLTPPPLPSEFRTVRIKAVPWRDGLPDVFEPGQQSLPGLFGFHAAPPESDQIVITGREMDAMAVFQQTGIAAVSLPGGPYQLPLEVVSALERFERIYIWLDDNCQGADAATKIANKLGVDRCLIVRPRRQGNGEPTFLNASEALVNGMDLQRHLDDARPTQHEQIMDFSALRDAVQFELMNPEQVQGVQSTDFPGFNETLKGLRSGELTVLTGPTGVGKTTILSQLSLDFCKSGVSTLWGSFEVPNVRLLSRMMGQFARRDLSKDAAGFEEWSRRFEQLPMYFLKFHGSTQPSEVIETIRHAVYAYDVKHIIIDNLQFMLSMQHKGWDKFDAQDHAIATFRRFATDEQVHITVVVHARKEQAPGPLQINSVFGSAKITQEADNVLAIQRYGKGDNRTRYFEVLKNRFDGTLGKVYYRYDPKSVS
ncbi:hypothetical protein EV182_004867, partial [Spiromyces aspiralis]